MKIFQPNSVIYFLAHTILVILGFFLSRSPDPLFNNFGVSLLAAGITGYIVFVYIYFTQKMTKKIDILTEYGLEEIFEARGARIKKEYDQRLHRAKKNIDILGFGLSTLRGDYLGEFERWKRNADVRILLIDPEFPSMDFSYADQRDREENNNIGTINSEVRKFIAEAKPFLDANFSIRLYRCIPAVNIFRVDNELFWGPYLISKQSRNNPTFVSKEGGKLFSIYCDHFEKIWGDEVFSRNVPSDWLQ